MEGTIYRKRRLYIAAPHTAKHHKTRCGAEKPTAYPKKEEYTIFPDVFAQTCRPGSQLGRTVASVDSELRPGHKSRGVTGKEDNCTLRAHKRQSSSSCHRTSITDIQVLWLSNLSNRSSDPLKRGTSITIPVPSASDFPIVSDTPRESLRKWLKKQRYLEFRVIR
jgi:hypothetical protein